MSQLVGKKSRGQPGRDTWQARKSAETRSEILDATIRSYIEVGYSRTTLQQIADRTGLSRGAIIYHFPSMVEVTQAAVSHLQQKRLAIYRDTLETIEGREDFVDHALETLWQQISDPLFTAYNELTVAARTDPELEAILRPAQEEYEREWDRIGRAHSHASSDQDDRFALTADLAQYLMIGMAVSFMWTDADYRRRRLIEDLKVHIRSLLRDGVPREVDEAIARHDVKRGVPGE
ncbi:TetR/AcrR family transcriptional regulator [Iodidimonas sp. SYSU 1G8]|uniref:TetR/AcrR family transcriptional regulator n=1 Tax=Iodidimonas sp. SYSU 1G8 TaxID=3133967 RepID=UPI0031FE86B0